MGPDSWVRAIKSSGTLLGRPFGQDSSFTYIGQHTEAVTEASKLAVV
jgi:hypothetical protein